MVDRLMLFRALGFGGLKPKERKKSKEQRDTKQGDEETEKRINREGLCRECENRKQTARQRLHILTQNG